MCQLAHEQRGAVAVEDQLRTAAPARSQEQGGVIEQHRQRRDEHHKATFGLLRHVKRADALTLAVCRDAALQPVILLVLASCALEG